MHVQLGTAAECRPFRMQLEPRQLRKWFATDLLTVTPNAAVQPQIRAQREFVGWNCLLALTSENRDAIEFAPSATVAIAF